MRKPTDQFDEVWVARCKKCGITRFASPSESVTAATYESQAHWDVLERVGSCGDCCKGNCAVELLLCPECARVPGPLEAGSYDKRLPDVDCSRCGRPYRGLP